MSEFYPPTNDKDRLRFLQKTVAACRADQSLNALYLGPDTHEMAESLVVQFEDRLEATRQAKQRLADSREDRRAAVGKLRTHLRDFWVALRRQIRRLGYNNATLLHYDLPLNGYTPRLSSMEHVRSWAKVTIEGDARAIAAGLEPVSSPSVAKLQTLLDAVEAAFAAVSTAESVFQQERRALATLRRQVNAHIRDIMRELRYNLHELPAADQREIMRRYGARFRFDDDEATAEEAVSQTEDASIAAGSNGASAIREAAAPVYANGGTAVHSR